MTVEAVIFDFIGTLANVRDYDLEGSKTELFKAVAEVGYDVDYRGFLEAYTQAHEKYKNIRYNELVEVTNAVWISEALNNLGFTTRPEDAPIKTAVNMFFEEYVKSLELRPCARNLLKALTTKYRLGLISNFTYAPVIYAGLRELDISQFFHAILVSEAAGWRKPNTKIFEEALKRLKATAEKTVYIGDSPLEDIKGAKTLRMKTVFVPSQFYSMENLYESRQKPDLIVKDICELFSEFPRFLNSGIG